MLVAEQVETLFDLFLVADILGPGAQTKLHSRPEVLTYNGFADLGTLDFVF